MFALGKRLPGTEMCDEISADGVLCFVRRAFCPYVIPARLHRNC